MASARQLRSTRTRKHHICNWSCQNKVLLLSESKNSTPNQYRTWNPWSWKSSYVTTNCAVAMAEKERFPDWIGHVATIWLCEILFLIFCQHQMISYRAKKWQQTATGCLRFSHLNWEKRNHEFHVINVPQSDINFRTTPNSLHLADLIV